MINMNKRSKRKRWSSMLVACLAATLMTGIVPAQAAPDGFHIMISNADEGEKLVDLVFPASAGWVFGDRIAYRCAYMYFSEGGANVAKVTIEGVGGYAVKINDKYGDEQHPQTACGAPSTPLTSGGTAPPLTINATSFTLGGLLSDATWAAGGCSSGSPFDYLVYDGSPWVKVTLESLGAAVGPCPPSIDSFSPKRGTFGTSVVLSGTNLVGATGVMFDGMAAQSFSVDSSTQITAMLPHGATSGPVSIVTADGVADASGTFTVTHDATLSLRLRPSSQGGLMVSGRIRIPDGTGACRGSRRVVIETRVHGSWRQRGRAVSHPDGSFADDLRSTSGWVRARVKRRHLAAGDICVAARDSASRQPVVGVQPALSPPPKLGVS